MNTVRSCLVAVASCLTLISTANAGKLSYQCTVSEQMMLEQDGSLKRPPIPWLIGKRFAVHRTTGQLTGPEDSMWSFDDSKALVLASGNQVNSFVSTTVAPALGGGVHFTAVSIKEFAESVKKPFVVVSGESVFSGTCD
jgi:hypothetical protein